MVQKSCRLTYIKGHYEDIYFFSGWLLFSSAAFAAVDIRIIETNFWKVSISGVLKDDDAHRLENIKKAVNLSYETNKKKVLILVNLNSDGGDIYVALMQWSILKTGAGATVPVFSFLQEQVGEH